MLDESTRTAGLTRVLPSECHRSSALSRRISPARVAAPLGLAVAEKTDDYSHVRLTDDEFEFADPDENDAIGPAEKIESRSIQR